MTVLYSIAVDHEGFGVTSNLITVVIIEDFNVATMKLVAMHCSEANSHFVCSQTESVWMADNTDCEMILKQW